MQADSRRLGHHERVHLPLRLLGALIIAAAAPVGLLVGAAPVTAASCSVMNFQFDPDSAGVVLSPQKLTVADGACVTLHNSTITSAEFRVGSRYKQTAPAFSDATPSYRAGPAGTTQPVTASGAAGTAHGSIVVKPAPKPARSSPPASRSPSPHPTHSTSPSSPPASKSPSRAQPSSPAPARTVGSPSPRSSPFLAGQPTPTPSPSRTMTVVSGPLQPPTDRGAGLPAALAALAVVGTAGALLRILLAEPLGSGDFGPVDDGRSAGAARL